MLSRRSVAVLFATLVLSVSTSQAAEPASFTTEAFVKAQQAGQPILIDISASWCPTCKAQAPIINGLSTQEKYFSFVVLEVDFDEQKDIVRALGARSQSTLIVFKGAQEIDRSVGSTDPAEIEALLAKALNAS